MVENILTGRVVGGYYMPFADEYVLSAHPLFHCILRFHAHGRLMRTLRYKDQRGSVFMLGLQIRQGELTEARSLKEFSLPHQDTPDSVLFAGVLLAIVRGEMGLVGLESH